jgi:predicted metalloprotease with PDZ domain
VIVGRGPAVALALWLSTGCARTVASPPGQSGAGGWTYEVRIEQQATALSIEASFPAGTDPELTVDDEADRFLREVAVAQGAGWQSVVEQEGKWIVPQCRSSGCRLRYRFLLAQAATSLSDTDVAVGHRGAFIAPPSTWLLRPLSGPADKPFTFHVSRPPDVAFATGVFPWPGSPDTYGASIGFLSAAPYTAFGQWRLSRMAARNATLEIGIAPGTFEAGEAAVNEWIVSAVDVVSRYYGRFPVSRALLLVVPSDDSGFGYGKTLGNGGASIVVPVGAKTTRAALADDWVLVHEMIHLAFPDLPRDKLWLSEGLATYVEPLARARTRRLSAEAVWSGLVHGLPNGLPAEGDQGLDRTHTWGRTYWGGALFCFLADMQIRKRTANRRSLDDAVRAILEQGGDATTRWEISRVLEVGDRATGVPVLSELYGKMATSPYPVDLGQLFAELGVMAAGKGVKFDDSAPLASIRRAMTNPG